MGSITPSKFTLNSPDAPLRVVVEDLSKQTGLEVDISAMEGVKPIKSAFDKAPFWAAVDSIAAQAGGRVVIGQRGKPVRIVPKDYRLEYPVSVDGPFRIAAKAVEARIDLQTGKRLYDLSLELAWEARLPVYRVDAHPIIEKARDDAGRAIEVKPFDGRLPVDGVAAQLRIPLEGLTRQSNQIALMQGTFRVTAAEEMLRFDFDDVTKAATVRRRGVEVSLRKAAKEGTSWIVELGLRYPRGGAVFESFETYWTSRNRLTLTAPDGTTRYAATDEELNGNTVIYRFKEDKAKGFAPMNLKGWKLEYEAPGPFKEVPVKFELKGISLP